ncbi:hypothetical protein FHL15_001594 [Xylaria flabelliformis]|uniref:Uncharacterized protein n=1 Tax=Xylaria flabelliformis TaxID=2512241 RepID=A0A553IAT8_9PEZI|nr:hypothetical protein FHL15_001594 [Xylaria flabelliformis]
MNEDASVKLLFYLEPNQYADRSKEVTGTALQRATKVSPLYSSSDKTDSDTKSQTGTTTVVKIGIVDKPSKNACGVHCGDEGNDRSDLRLFINYRRGIALQE